MSTKNLNLIHHDIIILENEEEKHGYCLFKHQKRREELKMSQRELAAKVGYKDNSTIAKMEKGLVDPTLGRLKQIAKALETTLPALLGYEEEENEVSSTNNNRI